MSVPIKLPCDECICFAACRSKTKVYCDILNKLALNIPDDDEKIAVWWGMVHLTLPNLDRIRGDHEGI